MLDVVTNFVLLSKTPDKVYEYDVEFGEVAPRQAAGDSSVSSTAGHLKDLSLDSSGQKKQPRKVQTRSEKSRIFETLARREPLSSCKEWATNHEKLWTLSKIPDSHLTLDNLVYAKASGRSETLTKMTFTLKRVMSFQNGPADLVGGRADDNAHHPSELTNALNAIISRHIKKTSDDIFPIGANKFFIKGGLKRIGALDAVRGYFTSVRPGFQDVLLNVNTATSPFYHPMTLSAFIESVRNEYGDKERLLKNKAVRILYKIQPPSTGPKAKDDDAFDPNHEKNRKRNVAGFGWPCNEQLFDIDDGPNSSRTVTVADYFKQKYNIALARPDLPAINVGSAPDKDIVKQRRQQAHPTAENEVRNPRAIWIPPELLEIEPNQPFGRRLNGADTSAMLEYAIRLPAHNQHLIQTEGLEMMRVTKDGDDQALGGIDMVIDHSLLEIPARVLPVPRIVYQNALSPRLASWDVPREQFAMPSKNFSYAVIDFRQNLDGSELDRKAVIEKMNTTFKHRGMRVDRWFHMSSDITAAPNREEHLTNALRSAGNAHVYILLLEKQDTELYADIKRICDRRGYATVCITSAKLKGKASLSYPISNGLAMKVNFKLGGRNHDLRKGDLLSDGTKSQNAGGQSGLKAFQSLMNTTMVMGADVIHPSGGAISGCPSLASVVANNDVNISNFPGAVRVQPGRQEVIDDMQQMVTERLKLWQKAHSGLPERILYYRDGVSESQYQEVLAKEGGAIKAAWDSLRRNTKSASRQVKIVFIVCGKRHNARFFAKHEKDTYFVNGLHGAKSWDDKVNDAFNADPKDTQRPNGNLKPGLIVDRVISRPKKDPKDEVFDFFLQSHAALKGTARSCHYVVLQNDFLTTDEIQELTHAFCYNYAKATKGISQAAPAYYADRLCTRGSQYLYKYFSGKADSNETPQMGRPKLLGDGDGDYSEDREGFRREVANWIVEQPEWKPNVSGRKNPWSPKMDEVMFYL